MRGLLFLAARYPLGQFILGLLFIPLGLWSLIAIIVAQLNHQTLTSSDTTIGWSMGLGLTLLGALSWTVCYIGVRRRRRAKAASIAPQQATRPS